MQQQGATKCGFSTTHIANQKNSIHFNKLEVRKQSGTKSTKLQNYPAHHVY